MSYDIFGCSYGYIPLVSFGIVNWEKHRKSNSGLICSCMTLLHKSSTLNFTLGGAKYLICLQLRLSGVLSSNMVMVILRSFFSAVYGKPSTVTTNRAIWVTMMRWRYARNHLMHTISLLFKCVTGTWLTVPT